MHIHMLSYKNPCSNSSIACYRRMAVIWSEKLLFDFKLNFESILNIIYLIQTGKPNMKLNLPGYRLLVDVIIRFGSSFRSSILNRES